MSYLPKDDSVIQRAIVLQNDGHWSKAASLLQDAGNQYRNPSEKQDLWNAAERSRKIALSD